MSRLKEAGLKFELEDNGDPTSDALKGMTVVISGNFSISRDAMKELITAHGGKASSSVSKKTSFLLAGTKPGAEKLKKCEELGVKVISEEQFRKMLPESETSKGSNMEELTLF